MYQMQTSQRKLSANSKKPMKTKKHTRGYSQASPLAINIGYFTEWNGIPQRAWKQEPVVQRAIDYNTGKIIERSEYSTRIYDSSKYRWGYYNDISSLTRKQGKKPPLFHFSDHRFRNQIAPTGEHTLHHIINFSALERFWNILVEYYPDLWGGMMKDILTNASRVINRGNSIYHKDFIEQLTSRKNVTRESIDREIDREQALLEQKAFQGADIDLNQDRPDEVGDVPDLLENIYAWMPGNLVVGPQATERSDDPRDDFDAHALYQKHLSDDEMNEYQELNNQIQAFNNKTAIHNDRKQYKTNHRNASSARMPPNIWKIENEVHDIITKISTLLARKEITNNTVWKRTPNALNNQYYSSPPETATIKVST